jgi:hypothetical protein
LRELAGNDAAVSKSGVRVNPSKARCCCICALSATDPAAQKASMPHTPTIFSIAFELSPVEFGKFSLAAHTVL